VLHKNKLCNFAIKHTKYQMIEFKFNKNTGIIETIIKGKTTINDFIRYIIALSNEKNLPETLKIITDATEGRFSEVVTPDDMYKIAEARIRFLSDKCNLMHDAFILSSSFETALGQLYKEYSKTDDFSFNIFATKEAAFVWLNSF